LTCAFDFYLLSFEFMRYPIKKYSVALYEATKGKSEQQIKSVLKNFVKLLAKNGDLSKAEQIIKNYEKYYNEQEGIEEVEVTVANEKISAVIPSAARNLPRMWDKKPGQARRSPTGVASHRTFASLRMTTKVDKSLIGGAKVRIGDDVYDGSLQRRLELMREELIK